MMAIDTDRKRIEAAFRQLRKQGFEAHARFWCCQSCGYAAITNVKHHVFYHRQDAEALDRNGNLKPGSRLHISVGPGVADGVALVTALRQQLLDVEWDGAIGTRPAVIGRQF